MMIRCGACRTQFDVPGEGRYACPSCGSVNLVRGPGGGSGTPPPPNGPNSGGAPPNQQPPQPNGGGIAQPGVGAPPPPPESEVPAPRVSCDDCGFEFIVGDIAVATCPNCGAEVETGFHDEDE